MHIFWEKESEKREKTNIGGEQPKGDWKVSISDVSGIVYLGCGYLQQA